MSTNDAPTALIVTAYREGVPFVMECLDVECGHYMRKDLVKQVRDAIAAAREDGITISISSAFRTMAKQQELYNGWKQGLEGFNPADMPGFSKHQEGIAIDIHCNSGEERERFTAIAIAHGLTRNVPREPWHYVASLQPRELPNEHD